MRRTATVLLNFAASGLCWFPMQIVPSLGWPLWVPACLVFVSAAACAANSDIGQGIAVLSSFCGVLAASVIGFGLWWPDDPIAGPWVPIVLTVLAVGTLLVASLAAGIGRRLGDRHPNISYKVALPAMATVIAMGLGAIAGNSELVARKISRDRLVAEERVRALYQAAARAVADSGDISSAHDIAMVRGRYKGPMFDADEWQGMTRNLLRRNGYVYQIHIAKLPATGLLVYALPIEYEGLIGDGLCLDDSARIQCPLHVLHGQTCVPCIQKK